MLAGLVNLFFAKQKREGREKNCIMVKVNKHKSRSKVSLVEQHTIGCVPTAYLKFMIRFIIHFEPLFSAAF